MKRTEVWIALALAIAAWIAAPAHPAAAQESAGAEAGAQADTQSDAGAQADAGAQSTDAGAQADATASNQSSADQQSAQSDTQATGTADTAAGETSTQANGTAQATGEAQQGQADSQRPLPAPNRQDGAARDRDAASQRNDRGQADQRQPADRDARDREMRQDTRRDQGAQRDRDMRDRDRDGRDFRDRDRDRDRDRRGRRDRVDFHAHIHFGAFTNGGLLINRVTHDSIFFHAGLREGDILISVDGHPIRSHADFHRWVVYEPGHRVPVVILRDGRRETVYIVYEEDMVDDAVVYDDQPQPVAEVQAFLGVVFDAQNPDAAIVVAVSPGSPAEQAGLRRGDIIVALNGQEVGSYHDAIGVINSMQPGDRLAIDFSRRVDDQTQAILAGKPGPGARSATLPQREVRGYRGAPQDVPPATETEIEIRRDNENRGLLNREPRQDGRRPLIPRLRN